MRIWAPNMTNKSWYLNLFYREIGQPNPLRVGTSSLWFGGKPEDRGKVKVEHINFVDERASLELFSGLVVAGIVITNEPGVDKRYIQTLTEGDEVELVNPREVAVVSPDMVPDLMRGNSFLQKQLSRRKRFV